MATSSSLTDLAGAAGISDLCSEDFAKHLDEQDDLADYHNEFYFPKVNEGKRSVYLCGNSLGLQPKGLRTSVMTQLTKWENEGVEGHFVGNTPWLDIDEIVEESMARLVGALPSEVVMMNSLTCNLHLMMQAFYRPTGGRFKILIEKKAFPSDYHAVVSEIQLHGLDPATALIEVSPRDDEITIRLEDIQDVLKSEGSSIALVLFSGVQYYTGQLFDMKQITVFAQEQGCKVGFDLAHAVGNVPLSLHEWGCDFACWCTYKYMNCGPGSMGGCFVHERHGKGGLTNLNETGVFNTPEPLRMAGWWGHRREDRFQMEPNFIPCEGANGFRMSNPPVLLIACIRASLDIFDKAGMGRMRKKSLLLTGYLEYLLKTHLSSAVEIFTPADPDQRGCQLSLCFKACSDPAAGPGGVCLTLDEIINALNIEGVMCDARKPNVIRVAPTPLYNSFKDVYDFVSILKTVLL